MAKHVRYLCPAKLSAGTEKVMSLKDSTGQDIKLHAGCAIIFHMERKTVSLRDKDGRTIYSRMDDDRRSLPKCIQTEEDFAELAMFVAFTHGFVLKKDVDRVCGPSFIFIDLGLAYNEDDTALL